eukprot:SAG31_NODE_9_length_42330_cov_441.979162_16_plen_92_part_00
MRGPKCSHLDVTTTIVIEKRKCLLELFELFWTEISLCRRVNLRKWCARSIKIVAQQLHAVNILDRRTMSSSLCGEGGAAGDGAGVWPQRRL